MESGTVTSVDFAPEEDVGDDEAAPHDSELEEE